MPLTTETIEKAQSKITTHGRETNRPYKMYDSKGLFLLVAPSGGKWWRFKYRFEGKEKQVSLGIYPTVSLAEARLGRDFFRVLLDDGIEPSAHIKQQRASQQAEAARQFAAIHFTLDNNGALSFQLEKRYLTLNPTETTELRTFLDATREVKPKVML